MDDKKNPDEAEGRDKDHGLIERIVKKGIETGIGAISRSEDSVRSLIDQMKLPKEASHVILEQVDETKKGLYTVVAKEMREFLQTTNFASDIKKILTGLAFEVKMEVRFKSVEAEDGATLKPDVSANVALKGSPESRKSRRPPPPDPPKSQDPDGD
jgi:hypothetical protein